MPRSSATSSPSLTIPIEPSRWLLLGLIVAHVLAGTAALCNSLPWLYRCLVLLCVIWSSIRQFRVALPQVETLTIGLENGRVELSRRGVSEPARVREGSLVCRFLVILRLRTESGTRLDLPVFRDSVDEESHRRLRVYLRCGEWDSEKG